MINSEVEKIISLARDKYTVHECSECTYRKCCDLYNGFGSAECLSRRVSISLMLGIEDSYFTKLLDDIEAAAKLDIAEAEANALAVGGVVEAARHTPGNAAAMREALVELTDKVLDYLHKGLIQLPLPIEDATAKARAALAAPARNCDIGTPEEQGIRCLATMRHWRKAYQGDALITAIMKWAQMPYEAQEGAGK